MANLLNLESIDKSYGIRPLLAGVSLGVQTGDRIGVLGVNGGGKTTLLEVLAGIEPPDAGRVSHQRSLRMAVVTQRGELPAGATVRDVALARWSGGAEHEWASDPRVRSVLDGLGLHTVGLEATVDRLSGGERRRVALAAALVGELDVVVLDEPTNHLDVEGVRWLADHLIARRCAVVVVTHDRWFLDTVCTRTWEVIGGRVEQYEGGYADWVYARAERARQADSAEQTRRNLARRELAWLRRGAPARTSKPKFRIDAAEALIADVPPPRDAVELMAFARRRLGRTVVELEDATVTVGDGASARVILDDVTWRVGPGDRLGIVGVNGSGKSTLLKAIAGEIELDSGKRVQGQTVRLGHLAQELDDLPEDVRVLDAIEDVARHVVFGKLELSAAQLAERLGFTPARQRTPVGDLSGGERRRLALTRVLMAEPNVLLLDEPTNDLDIDTLQQLEQLLDAWPGTLVVVSHDRYLVERVCDAVYALLGDGGVTHLPGGLDEYLARRDAAAAAETAPPQPTTARAAGSGMSATERRVAQKDAARLERQIDKLARREQTIKAELLDAGSDVDHLVRLDAELRAVLAEKDDLETRWLEALEAL